MARLRDSDGNWINIGDNAAAVTPDGALCTIPHVRGGMEVPQSPVYLDSMVHTRSLYMEVGGPMSFEFWYTPRIDNADNAQARYDAATADPPQTLPAYDFSTFEAENAWSLLGRVNVPDESKFWTVPVQILAAARQHRWLKIVKTHGTTPLPGEATLAWRVHHTLAGQ